MTFSAVCTKHSGQTCFKARHRLGDPGVVRLLNRSKSIRKHGHLVASVGGHSACTARRAQETNVGSRVQERSVISEAIKSLLPVETIEGERDIDG